MKPTGDTPDRDDVADRRDRVADDRDRAADARDDSAAQREMWARQRDQAVRDRLWEQELGADARVRSDRLRPADPDRSLEQALIDREVAVGAAELAREDLQDVLEGAQDDRGEAAADRDASRRDRRDAARDRASSSRDRDAAAGDRAQAEIEAQLMGDRSADPA